MDGCSRTRARIEKELTIDEFHPFLHAGETEAAASGGLFEIKTGTGVVHPQLDLGGGCREKHVKSTHAAVLEGVLKSFLQYAEEAERNFFRKSLGDVFSVELNLEIVALGEILAKSACSGRKAQEVESGGVKAVRQSLNISGKTGNQCRRLRDAFADVKCGRGKILAQAVEAD